MAQLKDSLITGDLRVTGTIYGVGSALTALNANNISSGTLPVARGGTGQTSIANIQAGKDGDGNTISSTYIKKSLGTAAGDIIYFSAASTPAVLAKGSDGQVLKLSSGVPVWGTDNDTKNTAGSTDTSSKIFLIGATSQAANPQTYSQDTTYVDASGYLYSTRVYNAVWNDYAEYRIYNDGETPYGKVVCENGDDSVSLSTKRLQPGAMICSDTFGHCMGEEDNSIPIAVAGRVLAYPLEPREEFGFFIGQAVCAGPNGTVSIMTKDEVKEYPECVVGYISAVPKYEEWGTNKIKVNGRIWIKIK